MTVIPIMIIKTSAKKECDDCAKPIEEVAFTVAVRVCYGKSPFKSVNHRKTIATFQRIKGDSNRKTIAALLHAIKNIFWLSETEKVLWKWGYSTTHIYSTNILFNQFYISSYPVWTLLMEMRMNPEQPWEICCVSPHVQTPFSESFRRSLIDYTTPLRQKIVDLPVFSDGEDSWIECGYFVPVFL